MEKSTISMAIFNSYVKLPEGIWYIYQYQYINDNNHSIDIYIYIYINTIDIHIYRLSYPNDRLEKISMV